MKSTHLLGAYLWAKISRSIPDQAQTDLLKTDLQNKGKAQKHVTQAGPIVEFDKKAFQMETRLQLNQCNYHFLHITTKHANCKGLHVQTVTHTGQPPELAEVFHVHFYKSKHVPTD